MLKNEKGFSLIQLVIGFGIMGIASVILMEFMKMGTDSTKSVEARFDMTEAINQIVQILGNPISCKNTFNGIEAILIRATRIKILKNYCQTI